MSKFTFQHFYKPSKPFLCAGDKSDFANFCCESLYKKFAGDITNPDFIKELKYLHAQFDEFVRNIYEVEEEVPLFAYSTYLKRGWDESRWDEDETNEDNFKKQMHKAILDYYS